MLMGSPPIAAVNNNLGDSFQTDLIIIIKPFELLAININDANQFLQWFELFSRH